MRVLPCALENLVCGLGGSHLPEDRAFESESPKMQIWSMVWRLTGESLCAFEKKRKAESVPRASRSVLQIAKCVLQSWLTRYRCRLECGVDQRLRVFNTDDLDGFRGYRTSKLEVLLTHDDSPRVRTYEERTHLDADVVDGKNGGESLVLGTDTIVAEGRGDSSSSEDRPVREQADRRDECCSCDRVTRYVRADQRIANERNRAILSGPCSAIRGEPRRESDCAPERTFVSEWSRSPGRSVRDAYGATSSNPYCLAVRCFDSSDERCDDGVGWKQLGIDRVSKCLDRVTRMRSKAFVGGACRDSKSRREINTPKGN